MLVVDTHTKYKQILIILIHTLMRWSNELQTKLHTQHRRHVNNNKIHIFHIDTMTRWATQA